MDFLRSHPYLIANIPTVLIILVLAYLIRPRAFGQLTVLAGLACVPCALIAFTFEGDYWSPVRVGGFAIGIEDVVFCFAAGALAWLGAVWPFRTRCVVALAWRVAIVRYLLLSLVGGSVFVLSYTSGQYSMTGFAGGSLLILIALIFIKRELWVLVATGVVAYTFIHVLSVRVQFWIWPDYVSYWNPTGLMGTQVMGVPVIEFAWAAVFGGVWPVIAGYVFDVRLGNPPARWLAGEAERS